MKRLGMIVIFKDDVPRERAENVSLVLKEKGLVEFKPGISEFDDSKGCPVWHVPS